jgi:AraC-like DNA-binding protein
MAFARAIVYAYAKYGQSAASALKQAQIAPVQLARPNGRMTARQMEVLSATAMKSLDDEGLGAFERKLPWGSYGMLARASLTAPDLRLALTRWCRHHGLLTNAVHLELSVVANVASIALHERAPLPAPLRELSLAFVLRNVHGLACWYVDSRIPLLGTHFPFAAPQHAQAYLHMFPGGPRHFDAPVAELRFDARYLALPLRRDEKALQAMLQRALPITVLQYRRDRLLAQQVRQVLATRPTQSHSAHGIAELLHVSARTLHRQLKEEGVRLQELKDEVRSERAKDLLYRSTRPIKQIAAATGFLNEKSFSRAFREWTGLSPGDFRKAAPL